MAINIESMHPRDFFILLKNNVFCDDFQIFLRTKQKWKDMSVDSFDYSMNPSSMGQYGMVSGNIHFAGESVDIPIGPTVVKIAGHNVRCEVTNTNCIRSSLSTATIGGGYHDIPYHTNIEVTLLFTYDGRLINNDWTHTNCETDSEIDELVEREDMISKKKKTVFDILDFDE